MHTLYATNVQLIIIGEVGLMNTNTELFISWQYSGDNINKINIVFAMMMLDCLFWIFSPYYLGC